MHAVIYTDPHTTSASRGSLNGCVCEIWQVQCFKSVTTDDKFITFNHDNKCSLPYLQCHRSLGNVKTRGPSLTRMMSAVILFNLKWSWSQNVSFFSQLGLIVHSISRYIAPKKKSHGVASNVTCCMYPSQSKQSHNALQQVQKIQDVGQGMSNKAWLQINLWFYIVLK